MITFGVINFKSIASAALEPKRLTVIAGANSSGKSSLLQSLLFTAQTAGEPTPVINGDLVRLGEATDVIRNGTSETTLEFTYPDVHPEGGDEEERVDRTLRIGLTARDEGRALATHELSVWEDRVCKFMAREADSPPKSLARSEDQQVLRVAEAEQLNLPEESYVTVAGVTPHRLYYAVEREELERRFFDSLESGARPGEWALEELIRFSPVTGRDTEQANRLLRITTEQGPQGLSNADRELLFAAYREVEAPDGWVSETIVGPRRGIWQAEPAVPMAVYYARLIGRGSEQVDRLADAVLYLGPLRDDPRVAYPLGHTIRALPVGEKGEFTAAYLRENHRARIAYRRPDGTEARHLLPDAVNAWCEHLGIAERIKVTPQGKLGHQLGLWVGGAERDPTAIGVGASQLLPVIVMVLGAPQGSIVLLEQPELHLHPKVQSRLADFLLSACENIRIVVETHSEYLITRLRRRIAEGTLDRSELAVLFASQRSDSIESGHEGDAKEPNTVHTDFERLAIDELGDFERWPEDFFDSLGHDSVELARAVERRLREGNPSPEEP